MQTKVDEIAAGLYRLSTFVPEVAAPAGFAFNQFLIADDEPLLFHTGPRQMFPLVREAVARVLPPESLRWIMFSHFEADECGSMNQWLATAPHAQVAHGEIGAMVSLMDQADRAPRPLADGEAIDLGSKRVRFIATPHVPHAWDAGLVYEETAGTLFVSDLFTRTGDCPALTGGDIVGPAAEAEAMFQSTSLGPATGPTIRRLAVLRPTTLALMHGASFQGDCASALHGLADFYDDRLRDALAGRAPMPDVAAA